MAECRISRLGAINDFKTPIYRREAWEWKEHPCEIFREKPGGEGTGFEIWYCGLLLLHLPRYHAGDNASEHAAVDSPQYSYAGRVCFLSFPTRISSHSRLPGMAIRIPQIYSILSRRSCLPEATLHHSRRDGRIRGKGQKGGRAVALQTVFGKRLSC